jgi:hypothetical protein
MVECPPPHSVHLIQKTRFLAVLFGILTSQPTSETKKNAAVLLKPLTQKELTKQHEQIVSIIWFTLSNLKPESEQPVQVKICFERLVFKLLEDNLRKARLIMDLLNASA